MRASSLVGHVLEGRAVLSQVQTDELHDALTAHDVAAEVANHVDNVLGKVLEFACFSRSPCSQASRMPVSTRPL